MYLRTEKELGFKGKGTKEMDLGNMTNRQKHVQNQLPIDRINHKQVSTGWVGRQIDKEQDGNENRIDRYKNSTA